MFGFDDYGFKSRFNVAEYRSGLRRTLRLICPGQWWIGRPSSPMTPHGLLIWNAPPGTIVHVRICGTPLAASHDGMSTRQFEPSAHFEKINSLIEWPVVDTSAGVELELRTPSGKYVIADEHPDLECILYGIQVQR